ncbi:MAG: tetratricopeptide repeat protein [Bacteroidales bacterium]|jgi:Flp pilus assembly protein TadD|nr:tetratricopeptide repeat protein [Bacteroidales bacterium]
MKLKLMRTITAMIFLLGFAVNLNAQSATEAVDALKEGVSKSQAKDYLGAVESFKKCVTIYEELGEFDNENRATAVKQIPVMQYKYALDLYKQKDYDGSIEAFEKLAEYSETYDNESYLKKAEGIIPQLYRIKGTAFLKEEKYDQAITAFNHSLEYNPNDAKVYVYKTMALREQDNAEALKESANKGIEVAIAKNKTEEENDIKSLAGNYFLKKGAEAFTSENYEDAAAYFTQSLEYKEADSDLYYQLSSVYNKLEQWDQAIEMANKSLEIFDGEGTTRDAKIYYELGNAYYGKGDNASACDAYSKAAKGDYQEAAEYQMKHVVQCN